MTQPGSVNDGLTATDRQEIREQLRAVARSLLGKSQERIPLGWSALVDSGWLSLEVPEELGGAGVGFHETGLILNEMGRAATTSSYLGSAVLGVGVLQVIEPSDMRDQLFSRLAGGTAHIAAVLPTDDDAVGEPSIQFKLRRSSENGLFLEGTATFVLDACEADFLIVFAETDASEPVAVVVERGSSGLGVASQPVLDSTRTLARVSAEALGVDEDSILKFSSPDGALRDVLDRATAAIACDSLGIISAMVDETVAYVTTHRRQFGRAIGSFQAVKHACADMFVALQVSSELVGISTAKVAERHEDRPVAVSMAKSYVTEAAVAIAGKAVQLHGGIGYTWEAGLHVYQKRALLNRSLFGSPGAHRRRLAERYRAERCMEV